MNIFIFGAILAFLGIGGMITMAILLHKQKIWFGAGITLMLVFLAFLLSSIPVMQKGVNMYEHELQNKEITMGVIPTTASLPINTGDTAKIYGYTEDGTLCMDNVDKLYKVYSVEDSSAISSINIRLNT